MKYLVRLALVALLCPVTSLAAQMLDMQPGAKVRVQAAGAIAGTLKGVVISRSADSLTIASSNGVPVTVPIARLTRAELSRGKSHSRGAIKGLVIGATIGLLIGLTPIPEAECRNGRCDDTLTRGQFMGVMTLGASAWGAGIGAIVGSERWVRYILPTRVGLELPDGRPGISARWAFTSH